MSDLDAPTGNTTAEDAGERKQAASFADVPPTPMRAFARLPGLRALRSMRTAIYLLIALVIATVVPTLVPQRITNPEKVAEIGRTHPYWFSVGERLRVFDVFTSPWYMAIWVSLLVVLLLCLLPRTRAFVRQVRRSTATPRAGTLPRLPHTVEWRTDAGPEAAAAQVRSVLRRRLWRQGRANDAGQYVAEKGTVREAGSLLFHWSLFLLLTGLAATRFLGYAGQAAIVEGKEFVEAPIDYDAWTNRGSLGDSVHRGFTVALDRFQVDDPDTAETPDFVSDVRVIDGGREVFAQQVHPNVPLNYRGVKMYQLSFGWAPEVVVRDPSGKVVFDDFVLTRPGGPRGSWTGVLKVPSLEPQAGFRVFLFPDPQVLTPEQAAQFADDDLGDGVLVANRSPNPVAPLLVFEEWRGDLGLESGPQNVNVLDVSAMTRADVGAAQLGGDGFDLDDGLAVRFADLRHYSVFSIKRDPGLVLVLIGASLLLLGLIPALYSRRRRLWVWVRPDPDAVDAGAEGSAAATLVTLGGIAYQRKDAFSDEFTDVVTACRAAVPPQERAPESDVSKP
ncbi:MAG: cytochrome c biogenesis protein ResB [Acidimicrobiia bacterium]|nr:cytochrome c biogenesis protein ResB [Acidimicrobiia bacterium]